MTSKSNRLVSLPIGDNLEMPFGSAEELVAWSVQEQEAWSWLSTIQGAARRDAQDTWRRFESFHTSLRQLSATYKDAGTVPAFQDGLTRAGEQVAARRVAIRGTPFGDRIMAVLIKHGGTSSETAKTQAAIALAWLAPGNDAAEMNVGKFRAALPALLDFYSEEGGSRSADASITEMIRRANDELGQRQAELDECVRAQKEALDRWQDDVRTAIRETGHSAKEAIDEINTVKELFRTQMGLQAPVQYWTEKAASHRKLASKYRGTLVWLGLLSLIACVSAYGGVFYVILREHIDIGNSISLALLSFGGLALLTTAALWVSRILTRLYLSQHHLSIDAEERATMVTTYLALMNNNAATDTDRAIVLAALFRPTADGIVKDEAPPMASPAAFLSNLVVPGR